MSQLSLSRKRTQFSDILFSTIISRYHNRDNNVKTTTKNDKT